MSLFSGGARRRVLRGGGGGGLSLCLVYVLIMCTNPSQAANNNNNTQTTSSQMTSVTPSMLQPSSSTTKSQQQMTSTTAAAAMPPRASTTNSKQTTSSDKKPLQAQVTIIEAQQPQATDMASMYVQIPIAEQPAIEQSDAASDAASGATAGDSAQATPSDAGAKSGSSATATPAPTTASKWNGPWPKKFQIGYIKQSDLHQVLIESLKADPFVGGLGGETSSSAGKTSAQSPAGKGAAAQQQQPSARPVQPQVWPAQQQQQMRPNYAGSAAPNRDFFDNRFQQGQHNQMRVQQQHQQQQHRGPHKQHAARSTFNGPMNQNRGPQSQFAFGPQAPNRPGAGAYGLHPGRPMMPLGGPPMLISGGPMTMPQVPHAPQQQHHNQQQQQQQQYQFANFGSGAFKNQPMYSVSGSNSHELEPNPLVMPMTQHQPFMGQHQQQQQQQQQQRSKSSDYYASSWRPVTDDQSPSAKQPQQQQQQQQAPAEYQQNSSSNDDFDEGFGGNASNGGKASDETNMNRHPALDGYLGRNKLSPAMLANKMKQQQQRQPGQQTTKSAVGKTSAGSGATKGDSKQATKGTKTRNGGGSSTTTTTTTTTASDVESDARKRVNGTLASGDQATSPMPTLSDASTSSDTSTASSSSTTPTSQETSDAATTPASSASDASDADPDSEVIENDTTDATASTGATDATDAQQTSTAAPADGSSTTASSLMSAAASSTTAATTQQNSGASDASGESEVVTSQQNVGVQQQQQQQQFAASTTTASSLSSTSTQASAREETTPTTASGSSSSTAQPLGSSTSTRQGEVEGDEPMTSSTQASVGGSSSMSSRLLAGTNPAAMSDEALQQAVNVRTGDLGKTGGTKSAARAQQRQRASPVQVQQQQQQQGTKRTRNNERLVSPTDSAARSGSGSGSTKRKSSARSLNTSASSAKPQKQLDGSKATTTKASKQQQQQQQQRQSNGKSNKQTSTPKQTRMARPVSDRLQQQQPQPPQMISMTAAQAQSTAHTLAALLLSRCLSSTNCANLLDVCSTKQAVVPANIAGQSGAQLSVLSGTNAPDSSGSVSATLLAASPNSGASPNGNELGASWSLPVGLTSSTVMSLATTLQADRVLRMFPQWRETIETIVDQDAPQGYTLLLPSNEAIERLPVAEAEQWLSSSDMLQQVIDQHILESTESIDLTPAQSARSTRAAPHHRTRLIRPKGWQINQHRDRQVTINGKRVIYANQAAPSGGRIHIIDGLLDAHSPAAANSGSSGRLLDIMDTLKQCDKFDGFVTLAEGTGLTQILKQDGPLTVFVPSNEALRKIPDDELEVIKNNSTALKEFLMYHVVNGSYFSQDLRDGQQLASILNMRPIQVGVRVDGCSRRLVEANTSPMRRPDIVARNGVIHILDWYLTVRDNEWCDSLSNRQAISGPLAASASTTMSSSVVAAPVASSTATSSVVAAAAAPTTTLASTSTSSASSSTSTQAASSAASERLQQLGSDASLTYATRVALPPNHKPYVAAPTVASPTQLELFAASAHQPQLLYQHAHHHIASGPMYKHSAQSASSHYASTLEQLAAAASAEPQLVLAPDNSNSVGQIVVTATPMHMANERAQSAPQIFDTAAAAAAA